MLSFSMPSLSKASGKRCVALSTDKSIDGGPLQIPRLAGRFPDSLLLYVYFFLPTIYIASLNEETIFFKETYILFPSGYCRSGSISRYPFFI